MSTGMNRVTLFGNLGADPDLRYTPAGQPVLNMRLATTESYVDRNGQRQERTDWHRVVLWGKRGESLKRILGKGSQVLIEGSLRTTTWEDRDKVKRYKTEVLVREVYLGRGQGQWQPAAASPDSGDPQPDGEYPGDHGGQDDDDEQPY